MSKAQAHEAAKLDLCAGLVRIEADLTPARTAAASPPADKRPFTPEGGLPGEPVEPSPVLGGVDAGRADGGGELAIHQRSPSSRPA